MRTTVIAAAVAVSLAAAGTAAAAPTRQKLRVAVARRTAPVKAAFKKNVAANFQRLRQRRAERRDRRRGQALADVQRYGHTKVRSLGDLLFHPATHGLGVFAGFLALGMDGRMAALAGGLAYFSTRSAKKAGDDWLKRGNQAIDVPERDRDAQ